MNRLDLNVLADYRWPRLLGQADAFVAQVRAAGWRGAAELLSRAGPQQEDRRQRGLLPAGDCVIVPLGSSCGLVAPP